MDAKDWPQVYAIASPSVLGSAFSSLVRQHVDAEMMRGVFAYQSPAICSLNDLFISGELT